MLNDQYGMNRGSASIYVNDIICMLNGQGHGQLWLSALPGGYGSSGGYFSSVGDDGYWWSATATGNEAYLWDMCYNYGDNYYKSYLFSVRCVQGLRRSPPLAEGWR